MARVYKRTASGPYWIDYFSNGKRIRESTNTKSKTVAERCLASRFGEVVQGKFSLEKVKRSPLFRDFAVVYLEWAKKQKKSWERDWYSIKQLEPIFGNCKLPSINRFLVEGYRNKRKEMVSSATVNREVACLIRILNVAVEWKKLQSNPIGKLRPLKEHGIAERFLSEEEADRLLTACSPSLCPIVTTALYTGMRKEEILGLTWARVNLKNRSLRLVETKNGEQRDVLLNTTMMRLFETLPRNSEFVFTNSRGDRYHCIKTAFAAAIRNAKIDHLRFHDLRHTWASWLVMGGVDPLTVKDLGGWKSLAMVHRYAHLSDEHRRKAVETLDGRLEHGTKHGTLAAILEISAKSK
jgi:integrase